MCTCPPFPLHSPSDNEWLMFQLFYSKQSLSNDVNPDVVYILKYTYTIIYEKKVHRNRLCIKLSILNDGVGCLAWIVVFD
jgi:hypothetical protein